MVHMDDIIKQKKLLKLYRPLQSWLINRADVIIGTSPVYLKASPWLKDVQDKTVCLPIGVVPLDVDFEGAAALREKYKGKKIIFSLGRLVPYKGYKYLIDSAKLSAMITFLARPTRNRRRPSAMSFQLWVRLSSSRATST